MARNALDVALATLAGPEPSTPIAAPGQRLANGVGVTLPFQEYGRGVDRPPTWNGYIARENSPSPPRNPPDYGHETKAVLEKLYGPTPSYLLPVGAGVAGGSMANGSVAVPRRDIDSNRQGLRPMKQVWNEDPWKVVKWIALILLAAFIIFAGTNAYHEALIFWEKPF